VLIPGKTVYRRRTIAEFKTELGQWLAEVTKTTENTPA
jgi:hypothetical protein